MGFHPLDLLKAIPVFPKSWDVHMIQAPMLYRLRPGQWVSNLFGITRNSRRERWLVRCPAEIMMSALSKCEEITEQPCQSELPHFRKADFRVHHVSSNLFICFFFTHNRQWLDCCELLVESAEEEEEGADEVFVSVRSFSAAVVPAAAPLAPLLSILFFWIPFGDLGQNKLHLRALRLLLKTEGIQVELIDTADPDQNDRDEAIQVELTATPAVDTRE